MNIDEQLAKNLTKARKSLQISQKTAADSIGVKLTTYGAWERGVNVVPIANLVTFCEIHNIPLSDIIPNFSGTQEGNSEGVMILFEKLIKSGANVQLVTSLKDRFLLILEELANEKQKVIEEKERLDRLVIEIEKQFGIKVKR